MTNSKLLRAVTFDQVKIGDRVLWIDEYQFHSHDYHELVVTAKDYDSRTLLTNMNSSYVINPNIDGHFFIVNHD